MGVKKEVMKRLYVSREYNAYATLFQQRICYTDAARHAAPYFTLCHDIPQYRHFAIKKKPCRRAAPPSRMLRNAVNTQTFISTAISRLNRSRCAISPAVTIFKRIRKEEKREAVTMMFRRAAAKAARRRPASSAYAAATY